MIRNIGGIVFATDEKRTNKYTEILMAEHNLNVYILRIDRTLRPPDYGLFREYDEKQEHNGEWCWRTFREMLFETSKLWKIEKYIAENLV